MNPQDRPYQPRPDVIEHPAHDPRQGFDLRVNITDAKTGAIIKHQPYDLHCVGGTRYFERPCGSGNIFYESGQPAGRWIKDASGNYSAHTELPHLTPEEAPAPKSADELASENEELRKELAALKAQKDATLKAQQPAVKAQPKA